LTSAHVPADARGMKNLMWSMVATTFAVVALLSGCTGGASCQSGCERAQALGCGSSACVSTCETGRTNAARAGCASQYQRTLNCGEENACSTTTDACRTQVAELAGCVTTFCVNNPGDTLCTNP
jgi:hypothetical protein